MNFAFKIAAVTLLVVGSVASPAVAQSEAAKPPANVTFSDALKEHETQTKQLEEAIDASRRERESKFGTLPEDTPEQVKAKYSKALADFRESIKKVRRVYTEYQLSLTKSSDDSLADWNKAFADAQKASTIWLTTIAEIYESDPTKYQNLGLTLMEIIRGDAKMDRVGNLLKAAQVVYANPPAEIDPALLDGIGFTAYANGDFELARRAWDDYRKNAELPNTSAWYYESLEQMPALWERELEMREKDKTLDHPIVEISTTKGRFVVELFEDSAPNAVASFIYLAENNFYDLTKLFSVKPQFGAQAGCRTGDGTGNAGYAISSERQRDDARDIFRGSLLFVVGFDENTKQIVADSASSQFLIASSHLPQFQNQATVFGRVIEGEEVLGALRKVDFTQKEQREDPEAKSDILIEIKVLRKRSHEYVPEIAQGKLPY